MSNQDTLIQFISDNLISKKGLDLGAVDSLLLSGRIDSHGVIRLTAFIQERFSIKVHPRDITLKNIRTVNTIARYLEAQQAQVAAD